jgi:hypothetical protein
MMDDWILHLLLLSETEKPPHAGRRLGDIGSCLVKFSAYDLRQAVMTAIFVTDCPNDWSFSAFCPSMRAGGRSMMIVTA